MKYVSSYSMVLRRACLTAWKNQGFCYVHTPILTSNDCEGAGEAFRIAPTTPSAGDSPTEEFFSRPSYLTVSSQLHLEALATAISRVYTMMSPCFRAERSRTNRHLAEFWMLEAEWAFTQNLDEICQFVEGVIKEVIYNSDEDMVTKSKLLEDFCSDRPWTMMSYTDAITELEKYHTSSNKFHLLSRMGKGSTRANTSDGFADELDLVGQSSVTDYPATLKPFYMRLNDDGRTVACFDLLVPRVGELVGGSIA